MPASRTVVIGAGIAGLLAARRLGDAGFSVVVVEQSPHVGGRLATRQIGAARLDYGAQFFTVRSDRFRALTDRWLHDQVAFEWCRGFDQPPSAPDGYPRYAGTTGMVAVAHALAASPDPLDIRTSTPVRAIRRTPEGAWRIEFEAGSGLGSSPAATATSGDSPLPAVDADAVICTAPVPLTLEMLRRGGTVLPAASTDALEAVRYEPALAVLTVLGAASSVPPPGGLQPKEGPFGWAADNHTKGISPVPAVTLHANGEVSTARWNDPADLVVRDLVRDGSRWLGAGPVIDAQLERWRYARPTVMHPDPCLVAVDGPNPLVCAGDAFGPARVEGAASSGWAAAEAVVARTG